MNYPFENDTSAVIKKLARKSVRFDKKKNLFCHFQAIIGSRCYDNDVDCSQCKISFIKIRKKSKDYIKGFSLTLRRTVKKSC